jgi:hypothetical protein
MYVAFDLLRVGESDEAVLCAVGRLFASNPDAERRVVGSVPTYVRLVPGSPIDVTCAAGYIQAALDIVSQQTHDHPDFSREGEDVMHTWEDPWKQASVAINLTTEEILDGVPRIDLGGPRAILEESTAQSAGGVG